MDTPRRKRELVLIANIRRSIYFLKNVHARFEFRHSLVLTWARAMPHSNWVYAKIKSGASLGPPSWFIFQNQGTPPCDSSSWPPGKPLSSRTPGHTSTLQLLSEVKLHWSSCHTPACILSCGRASASSGKP